MGRSDSLGGIGRGDTAPDQLLSSMRRMNIRSAGLVSSTALAAVRELAAVR